MTRHLTLLKHRMLLDLGYPAVQPLCPCGEEPATELHHIISRSFTQKNPAAREASEVKELMILLGDRCHDRAHNSVERSRYLALNIKRYGRARVSRALNHVKDALASPLPIDLPEVEDA